VAQHIRRFALGVTRSVFFFYGAILLLVFGSIGSHGNSVVTGALLVTLLIAPLAQLPARGRASGRRLLVHRGPGESFGLSRPSVNTFGQWNT
jgi:hypothetical protein